ncbi:2OG-Fe(II) oxygenase, partial [Acinetobacter bereziniae]
TDKFDVNVMEHPMMITLRGYSRQKDGRIHSDSKSKLLTILIYLNESWDAPNGRLRILNDDKDINNYVAEIGAGPGSLVAFKVTDNGWHGYIPYEGQRQSIQINFLTSEKANAKHKFFHGLSAKVKKIFG